MIIKQAFFSSNITEADLGDVIARELGRRPRRCAGAAFCDAPDMHFCLALLLSD